ncbi:MarR family transcriptional regulator [Luteibacter anthropi]|uniref:MarR family transcriptional regulator n=1 Tax=Luteibacter anthropi TaxID=564369 RepID=A0A7X5ZJV4_9GAMM|nr:MarR family transcriptional regulator [Luteibacter anthropi]NII08121.1 MarR family transcriptional regulator [Luteibacter anthropi]URX64216.1 MarR family transcriptional regulator [Luteibacter anthropi]
MTSPTSPDIEAIATDLLTACGQLVRRLRAESNRLELTWSQSVILARLDAMGPTSTADLARAEAVKPQSMGASLAVLEGEGLVERSPHPSDGRQFLFSLTDAGRGVRERTRRIKLAWLSEALGSLDEAERDELARAASVIARLADTPAEG